MKNNIIGFYMGILLIYVGFLFIDYEFCHRGIAYLLIVCGIYIETINFSKNNEKR